MKNKLGFTIIELSVILSVIAIIIGTIIIGVNLVDRAKLDSVIADIGRFRQAVDIFKTKYGGLPGDLAEISNLPVSTPVLQPGNGNGIIDNIPESLQFWQQLSVAGLISGNLNGSDYTIPAKGINPGGYPASEVKVSGYGVYNDTVNNMGLAYYLMGVNSTLVSSINSSLAPSDAYYLDLKMDDGNPDTGAVIAKDAANQALNSCRSANSYTLTNNSLIISCYMLFADYKNQNSLYNRENSNCSTVSSIGTSRVSSGSVCPLGTVGTIIESCNDGTYSDTRHFCDPALCAHQHSLSDIITPICDQFSSGTQTLTCQANGVFKDNTTTTQCQISSFKCNYNQQINCPIGYRSSYTANCTGNILNGSPACTAITCENGVYLGQNNPTPSISTTTENYNCSATGTETCILPINAVTSGNYRLTTTDCKPIYTGGVCVVGAIREIGCPPGEQGVHEQICVSNSGSIGYYETTQVTCKKVSCGGEPIGSYRIVSDYNCAELGILTSTNSPANSKYSSGIVIEVCDYSQNSLNSAQWYISAASCH